jgi:hypothetical protein
MLALAVQVTACSGDDDDDDNDKSAQTADDSKSGTTAPNQTRPRGGDTASAGTGGSVTGGAVLTEATCLAGANRFPQASAECRDCVCETIASCGAACQELLVCALTNCIELLGDSVSVATCALKNCAAQANAPSAAIGLTEALTGLGACRPACVAAPMPPLSEPDASTMPATPETPDTSDAGATEGTDAGTG